MAKKEDTEARRAAMREWDDWIAKNLAAGQTPTMSYHGLMFFTHLQRERPDLLPRTTGDPWQTVSGWLSQTGKISHGA